MTLALADPIARLDKSSLTFSPSNWNKAQLVRVSGPGRELPQGSTLINHTVSGGVAGDGYLNATLPSVRVNIVNEDVIERLPRDFRRSSASVSRGTTPPPARS